MRLISAFILATLGALAMCSAQAADVTLYGEQCTNTKICYAIPNSASLPDVNLFAVITHPYVFVQVEGQQYMGTLPGFYPYPSNIVGLTMTAPSGDVVYLTAYFEHRTVCGGSGRGGGYCHVLWTLIGGTISGLPDGAETDAPGKFY